MEQNYLKDIFIYVPQRGELHYKKKKNKRWATKGQSAGSFDPSGYSRVTIKGKRYLLHRLIWIYHNGEIPKGMTIDHIDRNNRNNQIENLRLVKIDQNLRNRGVQRHNTTGVVGVTYGYKGKWRAFVCSKGMTISAGDYATIEEATTARQLAEIAYGYPSAID